MRARGRVFREMERRESSSTFQQRPAGRPAEVGPTREAARISGPFRRNAERAAVCPAMKIKHWIVPISPFLWYFTYLGRTIPGPRGPGKVRPHCRASSHVYLKILRPRRHAQRHRKTCDTPFIIRYLIHPDVVPEVPQTLCQHCRHLRAQVGRTGLEIGLGPIWVLASQRWGSIEARTILCAACNNDRNSPKTGPFHDGTRWSRATRHGCPSLTENNECIISDADARRDVEDGRQVQGELSLYKHALSRTQSCIITHRALRTRERERERGWRAGEIFILLEMHR